MSFCVDYELLLSFDYWVQVHVGKLETGYEFDPIILYLSRIKNVTEVAISKNYYKLSKLPHTFTTCHII